MCLVNRWGSGKAKHVNVPHLRIQESPKSETFVTKKVGTHVNESRRLDDETVAEAEN